MWCQLCGGISFSKVGILDRQCGMKAWDLICIAVGHCPLFARCTVPLYWRMVTQWPPIDGW